MAKKDNLAGLLRRLSEMSTGALVVEAAAAEAWALAETSLARVIAEGTPAQQSEHQAAWFALCGSEAEGLQVWARYQAAGMDDRIGTYEALVHLTPDLTRANAVVDEAIARGFAPSGQLVAGLIARAPSLWTAETLVADERFADVRREAPVTLALLGFTTDFATASELLRRLTAAGSYIDGPCAEWVLALARDYRQARALAYLHDGSTYVFGPWLRRRLIVAARTREESRDAGLSVLERVATRAESSVGGLPAASFSHRPALAPLVAKLTARTIIDLPRATSQKGEPQAATGDANQVLRKLIQESPGQPAALTALRELCARNSRGIAQDFAHIARHCPRLTPEGEAVIALALEYGHSPSEPLLRHLISCGRDGAERVGLVLRHPGWVSDVPQLLPSVLKQVAELEHWVALIVATATRDPGDDLSTFMEVAVGWKDFAHAYGVAQVIEYYRPAQRPSLVHTLRGMARSPSEELVASCFGVSRRPGTLASNP